MYFDKIIEKFSSTNDDIKEYELRVTGIILLIWGCLLYVVDSTILGAIFYKLPGLDQIFTESANRTLNLSITGSNKTSMIPSILGVIIIFIGIVLVIYSYNGLKAQANMIVCPIFYTLAFIFFIATIQNLDNNNYIKYITLIIFLACLSIGVTVHTLNKDNFNTNEVKTDPQVAAA